ncbi:MAG: hypothetical protein ACRDYW_07235 [Acidimicrobiales bacterium]
MAALRRPSLGTAIGACVVAAGWLIGLRSLTDNSFFSHLATGRVILDTGRVPSADAYTFTAHGEPWVVQSWLASWLYATVEAIAGASGLRLLVGLVMAALVALAWRLTRGAESLLGRLALVGVCIGVGAGLWGERPFMFGLLALACTMLAADGELDPRFLVPIAWCWVNVHGSFPLGVAYLVVVAAGRRLDGGSVRAERAALSWLVGGVLLGAVGPLGPKVLLFPVELLGRQDVLRNVVEWRSPTFDSLSQRLFLLQLVVAILLLVRRPTYRQGLVLAVFGAAALLSARNVAVASLAILPGMAVALPAVGTLRSTMRSAIAMPVLVAGVALALLGGMARLDRSDYDLGKYPVGAVAYVEGRGLDLDRHRLAAADLVGNLLGLVHGPAGLVFYDDRFDMFPDQVTDDHLTLVQAGPGARAVLDRHEIDLVLWDRDGGLSQRLLVDPAWRSLYADDGWLLLCRREVDLGGDVGRC